MDIAVNKMTYNIKKNNKFMVNNKMVDIAGLQRYHENLKNVLNTKETAGAADAALESAKEYADGLVDGKFDAVGSAAAAEAAAKEYADGLAGNYDAAGAAAQALTDAKEYADSKVDGKFDTVGAAATAEQNAKDYADDKFQVKGNYETAGAAAQALVDAKTYTDEEIGKLSFDAAGAADAAEQNAKDYADGKFQVKGNYEEAGAAAEALDAAKEYADGLAGNYDKKGDAAQALADAKDYADAAVAPVATDVEVLKAIDHDKLAADAAAAAVATILDGAPEKFDTLKEVADWIANNETAADAAALVSRVADLEAIDHDAYVDADATLKSELEGKIAEKVDAVEGSRLMTDAEGTKLDGIEAGAQVNVIESLEVNGVAATIEGKKATVIVDCYTKDEVNTIIEENERVAAEALADLDVRVKDLKDTTYNKTEIDEMIGNVIVVASDADIDNLFN